MTVLAREAAAEASALDVQRLYGLVVASEIPLQQARPRADVADADVVVRWGAPRTRREQQRPFDGVVALDSGSRTHGYVAVVRPDGSHLLRFYGACDAEISAGLDEVVVHPVADADPGIATVLTTGAVLAYLLVRRGHAVLHGSAVAVDGGAIAFTAPSGGGKSTMATLMCADGAALVTDDVLRVDLDPTCDEAPHVRAGATGLRLRKGADTLVDLFADGAGATPERRVSADLRQVLTPAGDVPDRLPLRALVVPFPDRRRRHVRIARIDPKQALFDLLSFPRLLGWQEPAVLTRQLSETAAIVSRVPVLRADVPWGPPFSPRVATELRDAVARVAAGEEPQPRSRRAATRP
jgi:hypothetical protein